MIHLENTYSSVNRPVLRGMLGAVSAAHPLAVSAGQSALMAGGSAVDAMIAAQAVLCVVAPDACGVGGDMFALVHCTGEAPVAVNGAGAAPMGLQAVSSDGANSITIPGIVDAWATMSARWGRLSLAQVLAPAIAIARTGAFLTEMTVGTVATHRARLLAGGAEQWSLLNLEAGARFIQPALADLLEAIGVSGARAFYDGAFAECISTAVQSLGGALTSDDLRAHSTEYATPIITSFGDVHVATQPPMAQGILLSLALNAIEGAGPLRPDQLDHAGIEATEAAFAYRARAAEGASLLSETLDIDLTRAQNRGGPRAYLHTAGVAVSDANGMSVASLVSVFDDFGSCVFVPEGGFTLNNRAGGFTEAPNQAGPGRRPVHTLAPMLIMSETGVLAMSTPGADGQVQTLLQVVMAACQTDAGLAQAVAKPRWRSEGGQLLIEESHPARAQLEAMGHRVKVLADGDVRFGAVVCAGHMNRVPVALADWRRETAAGVV
jgi:gamma-glutamyltranspeptidase/glutathione hydrolase